MVSPNSSQKSGYMSAKPFLLWGVAGVLGIVALSALFQDQPQAISLERGLGPDVEASRL